MIASPGAMRRSDEELDLLLSRSLDGDLTPEEEQELAAILASDPRAARRREELAALVEKLGALPVPAAPLGLTARVGVQAADQAKGLGAIWRRLGIFPPPAMVRGVAALFVIVLIGINVLRSQSARQKAAEEAVTRDEGRVSIFFGEKKTAPPAAPAAEPVTKPKAADKGAVSPARVAARPAEPPVARKDERPEEQAVASPLAKSTLGREGNFAADLQSTSRDAPEVAGALRSEAAPRKMMAAPAPPAQALAGASAPLGWDVEIVGPSARAWALRRFAAPPPTAAGISASYRLTLDAGGKVLSVQAVEGSASETEALVKSLVFTPLGPDPPAEIEVTVRAR